VAAGWAVIDGRRWIGLDRRMPVQNVAAILGEILSEADALIRLRLKEQGLERGRGHKAGGRGRK
jgi:hypothetical protein